MLFLSLQVAVAGVGWIAGHVIATKPPAGALQDRGLTGRLAPLALGASRPHPGTSGTPKPSDTH